MSLNENQPESKAGVEEKSSGIPEAQTDNAQAVLQKERGVRSDPRTFDTFPVDSICPVCRTNDEGRCVLLAIDGTENEGIAQAEPTHLICALADQVNWGVGIIYRRL